MLRGRIVRALTAGVVATCAAVLSAAPDQKFSLAVLRRDGVMIPFAAYDGRSWSVPWPGAATAILPIALSDVPKAWWGPVGAAAPWTAWLPDNVKTPVKLLKPAHVPIFCGAHLAIATAYRGEPSPEREREPTVPKDGIATAGIVTILPITPVSVHSPDAVRLIQAITDKFNEEETTATANFTQFFHPYGRSMRAGMPIELESFYRTSDTSARTPYRTSYIEAVRRYPASTGDGGCGLLTFVRGWITEFSDSRKPLINIGATITYCDRADVAFMQPFGRIEFEVAGDRGKLVGPDSYWVYQLSSWRDEFYSVARVSADGVKPVVVVAGGGCPKEPER